MPFRILIADDEIDNERDEISELPDMLRAAGYAVRTTSDGSQAYDLVWSYNPDLVVLDIVFENQPVDGIEICEAIRRNGSEIPIILVTALMTETEEVLRGFEAGAAAEMERRAALVSLGRGDRVTETGLIEAFGRLMADHDKRLKMARQAASLIDGLGTKRIVELCLNLLG